jgi:hypothetical protein
MTSYAESDKLEGPHFIYKSRSIFKSNTRKTRKGRVVVHFHTFECNVIEITSWTKIKVLHATFCKWEAIDYMRYAE